MFTPTAYSTKPYTFDNNGQIVLGEQFKSWSDKKATLMSRALFWFDKPVFDNEEWAYEGQKDKVLAVLTYWFFGSNQGFKNVKTQAISKALGQETNVDFLFTERLLFNGKPSLYLIEFLLAIESNFIKVDY